MLRQIQPVQDSFITSNVGTNLIMKACGFIEAQHARIAAVSEGYLKLDLGHNWLRRLLYDVGTLKPVAVELHFADVNDEDRSQSQHMPDVDCSWVKVSIAPGSPSWSEEQFAEASRQILWKLRYHFMAF